MPNNHPYDKKDDRRQQDLNDLVDGAVNFGPQRSIKSSFCSAKKSALPKASAGALQASSVRCSTPSSARLRR